MRDPSLTVLIKAFITRSQISVTSLQMYVLSLELGLQHLRFVQLGGIMKRRERVGVLILYMPCRFNCWTGILERAEG